MIVRYVGVGLSDISSYMPRTCVWLSGMLA